MLTTFSNLLGFVVLCRVFVLPEAGCATTHDLTLANELGVEFATVEGEENVEVDACMKLSASSVSALKNQARLTVESALRRVHALEVFFEILTREV